MRSRGARSVLEVRHSLADLARFIAAEPDFDTRWRLAEHLALRDDKEAPAWSASRGLRRVNDFSPPLVSPGRAQPCPVMCPAWQGQARTVRLDESAAIDGFAHQAVTAGLAER
jgi:hypothetical protein